MNKNKELIDKVIEESVTKLNEKDISSEDYMEGVRTITALYKARVDEEKIKTENKQDVRKTILDTGLKIVGYGLEGAAIVVPLIFYHNWMREGFNFEKEGYITSFTFKDMITNFRPRKK